MRHRTAAPLALAAIALAPLAGAAQTGGRAVHPDVRWSYDTEG